MSIYTIFLLFVLFQIKHFLADFPFQTKYMLGKFKDSEWQLPLLAHVGVHALFTFAISLPFGAAQAYLLALADATIHFTMDRIKASPRMLGRFKILDAQSYVLANERQRKHNTYGWIAIGFDQMVHHLTHYAIILWLLTHNNIVINLFNKH